MSIRKDYYKTKAQKVIKEFKQRNIEGYYCSDAKDAVKQAKDLMEAGSSISWGGSMSLQEIGLLDELDSDKYKLYDRAKAENPAEVDKIYHQALNSDYYLMSSNAITQDGKLVNVDGNGNRLAALIYGPKNVIIIAGMNKVVADTDTALKRVRNQAAPENVVRLDKDTPCAKTGFCHNCKSEDCICCQTVITRMSREEGRIKVILVGEELGY